MGLPRVGYCTNVHAGTSIEAVKASLDRIARSVRERVSPGEPLGIGLWLSERAVHALETGDARARLRDWLSERGLVPFTMNGFPYGDFHSAVVKHAVYEPDWRSSERADYTIALAHTLAALLPPASMSSISTLPLGWGAHFRESSDMDHARRELSRTVEALERIEDASGTRIRLALEPEPGCVLERSDDVLTFFQTHVRPQLGAERTRRFVGVCHDVCHAAVMFEEQAEVLRAYASHDVDVVKVQVSSAPCVAFRGDGRDGERWERLALFQEPRYLHQTSVRHPNGDVAFYEDLPLARERAERHGEWRVHFHVPIHVRAFGAIDTTQADILRCVEALPDAAQSVFEIETYAWDVLPESDRPELAEGIAAEMTWFRDALAGRVKS